MRFLPHVLAVVLTFGLVACGSSVQLPPVSPDEVSLFMAGSMPEEDYKIITSFSEKGPLGTSDQELITRARERAAELGADGVIITDIRSTSEGGIDMNLQQEQEKILRAQAIFFPSRHPELQERN